MLACQVQAAQDAEMREMAAKEAAAVADQHCRHVAAITAGFRQEAAALKDEAVLRQHG